MWPVAASKNSFSSCTSSISETMVSNKVPSAFLAASVRSLNVSYSMLMPSACLVSSRMAIFCLSTRVVPSRSSIPSGFNARSLPFVTASMNLLNAAVASPPIDCA